VNSLYSAPDDLEEINHRQDARYEEAAKAVLRWEELSTEDADVLLVAFGTSARVCQTAVQRLRDDGVRAGLLRPVTVRPFPHARIRELADRMKLVLSVEMNLGQMVEDVRLAVEGRAPVHFEGRTGGNIPAVGDVVRRVHALLASPKGGAR